MNDDLRRTSRNKGPLQMDRPVLYSEDYVPRRDAHALQEAQPRKGKQYISDLIDQRIYMEKYERDRR